MNRIPAQNLMPSDPDLAKTIPTFVCTAEEGNLLLRMFVEERNQWETALEVAIADINSAIREYWHAQRQVSLMDLRVGRTKLMIRECGFEVALDSQGFGGMQINPCTEYIVHISGGISLGVVLD